MNRISWISCAVVIVLANAAIAEDKPASPLAAYRKILFLGNSITLHAPAPAIDWTGNWGMAASAEDKDFVHLLTNALSKNAGRDPKVMVKNIAAFERNYANFDLEKQMQDAFGFGADLVIVAIGENVPKLESAEAEAQFAKSLGLLLGGLKAKAPATIVVRSCFWANPKKDQILKKACESVGGTFVDISGLSKDESNYARSERKFKNKGVGAHPGDKGMQAIADAILKAISSQ